MSTTVDLAVGKLISIQISKENLDMMKRGEDVWIKSNNWRQEDVVAHCYCSNPDVPEGNDDE